MIALIVPIVNNNVIANKMPIANDSAHATDLFSGGLIGFIFCLSSGLLFYLS
jgi:hypothetical protein